MTMRVLVCGGRKYGCRATLRLKLNDLHAQHTFTLLIHGGATGADALAGDWANGHNVPTRIFPADWDKHGRSAGPIRNQRMIEEGKPDLVLAFPGGRGTADMIAKARAAKINVVELSWRAPC